MWADATAPADLAGMLAPRWPAPRPCGPGRWEIHTGKGGPLVRLTPAGAWWELRAAMRGGAGLTLGRLLRENARLTGGGRLLPSAEGGLEWQADLAWHDQEQLGRRIREALSGLEQWLAERPPARDPVAAEPDARLHAWRGSGDLVTALGRLLAERSWPLQERHGATLVEVTGLDRPCGIRLEEGAGGARLLLPLGRPEAEGGERPATGPAAGPRNAARLLLVGLARLLRQARPVAWTDGTTAGLGLEIVFASAPSPEELEQAARTLCHAAACGLRESEALADPDLAARYVELQGAAARGWAARNAHTQHQRRGERHGNETGSPERRGERRVAAAALPGLRP